MNASRSPKTISLAVLGAAIGGCVGFFAFFWLERQGLYAIMLPAVLMGLGAGYFVKERSQPLAISCAFVGLALCLFTEWKYAPFKADNSLSYFITHLRDLSQATLGFIALGSFLCYRLALGIDRQSDADPT